VGALIHRTGDIFTTRARAIGHGVNTAGVMGAGIAVQFRDRFPDMYVKYRILCQEGHLTPGSTFVHTIPSAGGDLYVYNIASQNAPGPHAQLIWLRDGVRAALRNARENGVTLVALPRIGSGIGGLDEAQVEATLESLIAGFPGIDLELWTYA
jgi:O-acetyl-ADP-ribose deacetylase (regulator of RNase III)